MSHTVTVTRTTTSTTSAIILNTGYVKSIPGLLKLAEVILGGIILGLLIYNKDMLCSCWLYGSNNSQLMFLSTVSTFFIASLLLLISCLLSISTGPIISKTNFEFIYHGAGFVLLLITAGLFLVYVDYYKDQKYMNHSHFVVAGILALVMAAFYLISSIWGYRSYRGP